MNTLDNFLKYELLAIKQGRKFIKAMGIPEDYKEDYLQESRIVLWDCLNKFDESLGYSFSTYLYPAVWNKLTKYHKNFMRNNDTRKYISGDLPMEEGVTLWNTIPVEDDVTAIGLMDEVLNAIANIKMKDKEKMIQGMQLLAEGYPEHEVAKLVGIKNSTFNDRKRKIKEALLCTY